MKNSNTICSKAFGPVPQSLKLPCTTQLNVLRWGEVDNKKPSCLLFHGLDNNARVWDALAYRLSNYFVVYAIDFRGHGDSGWADSTTYNTEHLIDDVEHIRQCLNLDKFYLIGHSLGGRISSHYAARFSEHVIALVLADVGPEIGGSALEKMRADSATSPPVFTSRESYIDYLKQIYMLADDEVLVEFAQHSLREEDGLFYNKTDPQCRDAILNPMGASENTAAGQRSVWQALEQVSQPTLLLRGAYSAVLRESVAQRMIECLANAQLATIKLAGHAIMMDNPSQTIQEIEGFLMKYLE